jgi:hypothetical protein
MELLYILIGAILAYISHKLIEYEKFKKRRRFFFYCLYDLYLATKFQIEIYEQYIKHIDTKENDIFSLPISTGFNLEAIKTVPNDDLYRIFTNKKDTILDLSFLLRGYGKIQGILDTHKNSYQAFFKDSNETIKQFYEKRDDFTLKLQKIYDNLKDYKKEETLISEIDKIMTSFNGDSIYVIDVSVHKYMEELITPIEKAIRKHNSQILLGEIERLSNSFNRLNRIRDSYKAFMDEDSDTLRLIAIHYFAITNTYKKYFDKEFIEKANKPNKILN